MGAALPRFGALIAAVSLIVACRAPAPTTPVGVSTALPENEAPKRAEAPRPAWPDFEAARAWPEAAPPVRALSHYRDGTLIHVRVEPSALEAYQALAEESPMPAGARVIAWHESPEGQLLGGYLLEKTGGAWRAREVSVTGAVVPGDGARCIRCHDMAPTDHLFGVRAPVTPKSDATESTVPPAR